MSDQGKKRSTEDNNPSYAAKRSKLQQNASTSAATHSKGQAGDKARKPSEYDDTGWMTTSELPNKVKTQFAKGSEQQSQLIDPQKDCEEAVRLLNEFTQQTIRPTGELSGFTQQAVHSTGESNIALSQDTKTSKTPVRGIETINQHDLASISCSDTNITSNDGIQTDPASGSGAQFGQSPGSSMSSPALIISTTPPKKRGIKKRKLLGNATTGFQRSQEKKSKIQRTPEKSNKLMIATRQLIHKTPSKDDPQTSGTGKKSTTPRKSTRLASLDYRISWKKGKKKIKKVKKKKENTSDDEDEMEDSFDLQFDSELEAKLEENAAKNNLTAINVKSILHHVITNEHVLQMVTNTMQDLESEPNQPGTPEKEPAVYEPKLTRSKLKEVTEKVGGDAIAWPLTPVKKPSTSAAQFAELDFPEDSSEDEDYKPSHDDTVDESDYESVASSQRSDFGSPCPGTPRSLNTSFLDDDETSPNKLTAFTPTSTTPTTSKPKPVQVKHIPAAAVPMGPPVARPRIDNRMKDDIGFFKQLDSFDAELKSMQEIIAHRTRSKHSINQSVEEIEASFVPPDIAHDMYDSDTDDKDDEWVAWLAGLNQSLGPESVEPPDDEQNDPEYNFLAEEETVDTEDFRDDKAVRVLKKELDELMDELFEAYGNEVDLQQAAQTIVPNQYNQPMTLGSMIEQQRQAAAAGGSPTLNAGLGLHGNAGISPAKQDDAAANAIIIMSDSERQQLQQQMQQHVQLLCQINVLSRACDHVQKDHTQAKKFLNELDYLANNFEEVVFGVSGNTSTQPLPYYSFFRTCNLQEACDIANNPLPERDTSTPMSKLEKNLNMPMSAMDVIVNSTVFMYPELLPTSKLLSAADEKRTKLKFTDSEDNLIALGLHQFRNFKCLEEKMKLVREHMMPSKTVKQLLLHVKNMCSARSGDNVIKLYRRHGAINSPPVPCEPVQPGMATAPSQLYESRKPDWLKRYIQIFQIKNTEELIEESKESSEESFQKIEPTKQSDTSSNIIIRKLTKHASKVKPKKPPRKIANIQPKPQETEMEVESESAVFVQEPGVDETSASAGQGNVIVDAAVDQGDMIGQVVTSEVTAAQPNSAIDQDSQVGGNIVVGQVGSSGQIVLQPNSTIGQDNRVIGEANQDGGVINPAAGQITPLTVSTQPVQTVIQSGTNVQQASSFQVVGGAPSQPTVVPVSSVSSPGPLVAPANTLTGQQPVYITINPNPGFQNRLPINTQTKSGVNTVQVTTAYPQVYTAVQRPVLRLQQQPTVYIAAPQPPTPAAPSLISPGSVIQVVNTTVATTKASSTQQSSQQHLVKIKPKPTVSKPKTVSKSSDSSMEEVDEGTKPAQCQPTDITDSSIIPNIVPQTTVTTAKEQPTVAKIKPLVASGKEPPAEQNFVKIKPKPKAPKPKSSKLKEFKSSDDSSQEDIDKANKLLDDVRKRISSGEEDKAKKAMGKKQKKKGRPKMVKQTPEQRKEEEQKAKKLLEDIKTKLETDRKEKESQSSSGNESTTSDLGESTTEPSMEVARDESNTQFFPVLSLSPEPEEVRDVNKDDKEVNSEGQNHNRKVDQTSNAVPIDIISPSTSGAGNQLKRRVLFQNTTSESSDKLVSSEQPDAEETKAVEDRKQIHLGSPKTPTDGESSSAVVTETADDQRVEKQTELTQSIRTQIDLTTSQPEQTQKPPRRERDPQTGSEISASGEVDEPQQSSTVSSPLARSHIQTQSVQTSSPPVNVQAPTQVRTPTYVQSPIPAVNQSITVPNSRITFHSPPVSNFPPQLPSKEGGKNTPSPPTVGKSPKGISALRNFKIDQGTVARQSPVTSPAAYQENKPKTARKLIESDNQAGSPRHEARMSMNKVSLNEEQQMEVGNVENQCEVDAVRSKNTEQMLQQEVGPSGESTMEDHPSNPKASADDGQSGVPESCKELLCEEPTLSDDDELKPLSKEEEEFCDAEEELMEDDEEDAVENADDDEKEPTAEADMKTPMPGDSTAVTNPTEVSLLSEKSTHSNVCTPPSSKAGSQGPSQSTKPVDTEDDPQSPETEDALTSPEMKSKSDGDQRPSVTFEDSNSMDTFQSGSNPHTYDGDDDGEEDMETADSNQGQFGDSNQGEYEDGKLKDRKSKRIAAKRIKTKLKKDLESTVTLLDPEIVSNDPLEALKDDLPKYIEFLRILNDFTDEQHPDMVKLYQNVCTVLAEYENLIEEFTAFLPQEVASQCGVLIPNLEFAKARLFLRQIEVHFSKQPTHFQKILSVIIEWGSKEDRSNQQLKDLILPQLQNQPHLKQEFSLLFPDNAPPESHLMDFEYINLTEDDSKEYDSFEEIEVSDSDEERLSLHAAAAAKKNAKKRKLKAENRKKRRKGGVIDPWKGLNAELQYGTHSCKCNCHDKSLDLRVQRKVRHCAYCSAGVSTEVISSFKGLKTSSRRPLSKAQLDMFDDNSNAIDGPEGMLAARKRSSGKSRKTEKNDSEDDMDDEDDEEEDEDEDEGSKDGREKRTYSAAVSHLSQMCDNLADALNEHGNTSDDEDDFDLEKYTEDEKESDDEKETEYEKETEDEKESYDDKETEDEKGTEDEDHDEDEDEDDDIHDDDDVDDDDDDMDVDDGAETGEDAEDEDEGDDDEDEEDEDKDKEDDTAHSLYPTSQESHSGDSEGSNPPSPHSPQSENEQDAHSAVQEETSQDGDSRGAATQKETYQDGNTMDAPPENQAQSKKEQISQTAEIIKESNITAQIAATESLEKYRTKAEPKNEQYEKESELVKDAKKNELPDIKSVKKDPPKDDICSGDSQVSHKENVKTTDEALSSKEIVTATPVRTVESDNAKMLPKPEIKDDGICEESVDTASSSENVTGQVSAGTAMGGDHLNQKNDDDSSVVPERPDANKEEEEEVGHEDTSKEKDTTPDLEKSSEADDEDKEEPTIVWTRDEDRLLLQSCQERDPDDSLFAEIAEKLEGKTPQQVSSRFHIMMQIFNSSQGEEDDDDDEDDEDGDDEEEDSEEDAD